MPQFSPYWLVLQPVATLIAALVVLVGVIITINHNRRRMRSEQLERRAKEREDRLVEAYSDFAAAGLLLVRRLAEVHGARERHAELKDLFEPDAQESYFDAVYEAHERVEADERAAQESRAALTSALTKLLLLGSEFRIGNMVKLYDELNGLSSEKAAERQEELSERLRSICRQVGVELHWQYQHERQLAEKGEAPDRTHPALKDEDPPSQPTV